LKNCSDPDAYIEVGLKGTFASEKPRERHNTHKSSSNSQGLLNQTSTTLANQTKNNAEDDEVEKE
jgi:hypothetical protein